MPIKVALLAGSATFFSRRNTLKIFSHSGSALLWLFFVLRFFIPDLNVSHRKLKSRPPAAAEKPNTTNARIISNLHI